MYLRCSGTCRNANKSAGGGVGEHERGRGRKTKRESGEHGRCVRNVDKCGRPDTPRPRYIIIIIIIIQS